MLRNYVKITLRHLWSQRLFTVLNVLGLAVGISASWVIYRMVDYEFSYDAKVPDSDRVFQVVSVHSMDEEDGKDGKDGKSYWSWVPKALLPFISDQISGVELTVPAYYHSYEAAAVPLTGRAEVPRVIDRPGEMMGTLPDYFKMIPYRWLAGNVATALNAPDKIVLTESRAEEYFPGISAQQLLGRTIVYDDTLSYSVSGVVADLDYPSSFQAQEFTALPAGDLTNQSWDAFSRDNLLFVKLQPGVNTEQVLRPVNAVKEQRSREEFAKYRVKFWFELVPLPDKHFAAEISHHTRTVNKNVLYGLMGVAAFLILVACINYVNLSTAQMSQRTREIGIRKTLGGTPLHLVGRLLGETFAITLAALLVSFLLSFLALRLFSDFIPEGMPDFRNYQRIIAFIVLLVLTITLLAGIYPAWLVTRVQTTKVLKGQPGNTEGKVRLGLRRGLIVFQFVIAQVFIVGAIVIGQQLRYTLHKDLGFNREAVLTIDIPINRKNEAAYANKQFVLKQELQRNPGISEVALGDKPMDDESNMFLFRFQSDTGRIHQMLYVKSADKDLMGLYDITLLAGRKPQQSDSSREYVINEAALEALGIPSPEAAIGRQLIGFDDTTLPIVGVVKDFHLAGFKNEIAPAAFTAESKRLETVHIKLPPARPGQWQKTIADIETSWMKIYPDLPFEYQFYDETIAALYTQERNTSKLLGTATGITIFISCLGLFGLASLTAFQRTKEIGIRKVLGASVSRIAGMLSAGFIKLVVIAILLASPIAWWASSKWLDDFVYRIDIEFWMFALAGLQAVMIALLTVSFQSIRAALMDPVRSLRSEG